MPFISPLPDILSRELTLLSGRDSHVTLTSTHPIDKRRLRRAKELALREEKNIEIEQSSGNIFSDLGFDGKEAKEELLKALLGAEIFLILKQRKLTQTKASQILGVKQPEISRLKNAKFSYYSVERLMRFLARLNCEVSIHITKPENDGVETIIAI